MAEETKKIDSKVAKKEESKSELTREYVIPLRREIMKVPKYRRAKKAVRAIKEFLAKHMRVENRDMRDIKMDRYLNNEVWFRGMRHPPARIKVKATKKDGIVYVELADVPEIVKFKMARDEKAMKVDEKAMKEIVKKEEEEKKEEHVETKDDQEKEKSTVLAGQAELKQEAKSAKHEGMPKQTRQPAKRMVLQK